MAAASSRSLPNLASVELDEITWTNEVIKAHKQHCFDRESKYLECQKYRFYQCLFFSSLQFGWLFLVVLALNSEIQ